jgi:hypothetical protein
VQDNVSGQGVTARPRGGRWEGWRPAEAESSQVRRPNRAAVEANNGLVHGGGEAIVRIVWSCGILGRDECESRRGRAGDREGSC